MRRKAKAKLAAPFPLQALDTVEATSSSSSYHLIEQGRGFRGGGTMYSATETVKLLLI